MPKVTIRPIKTSPDYKRVARTGGATDAGAMSDQSDATYIRRKADKSPLARYLLGTPTVPAGSDVATIVPGARLKQPTSSPPKMVTLAMSVPGTGKPVNKIAPTLTGPTVRAGSGTVAYTYETPAGVGKTAGPSGPWAEVLGKLAIRVDDGHKASDANRATVYDLYADVYHAARPTAAVFISPASPVTTTSYPQITATLSALIEAWQDNSGAPARSELAYELKVFSAAQYGVSGFDPATSPCVWSTQGLTAPLDYTDGSTPSTEDVAETPDRSLPNGVYRAYARGRRYFDAAQFGAWASLDFTVAVAPPTAPTFTAERGITSADISPAMTSATTPSGVVTSSGDLSSIYANWKAFDHSNVDYVCWHSDSSAWPHQLGYQFAVAKMITQYAITSRNDAGVNAPKTWTFEGSNDGSAWTVLDTQTNLTDWATLLDTKKTFPFINATAYLYCRLNISAGNHATYVSIGELEMMESVVVCRVVLAATAVASAGATSPLISFERTSDDGATWAAVRGATDLPAVFGTPTVIFDYEAPRGAVLSYRANVEATVAEQQLVSAWTTAAVAGTIACRGWNLKCPLDPSLSMLDVNVNADPEWSQDEEAATFRPVGRKFPVIVSMSMGGADGAMTISARTADDWAALEVLREYRGALLLESPYGWSRYIRIISRSWVETGEPGSARRRLTCSYLEVEAP